MPFGQLDVRQGNERQRRLLQQLMAQMQGRQGALGAIQGLPGGLLGLLAARSPRARFAQPFTLPAALANALGPGGFGRADQFTVSPGPGMPIPGRSHPIPGGLPPTFGGNPIPGAPTPVVTNQPSAPSGQMGQAQQSGSQYAAADPLIANGMMPLGNGVYYDPNSGVIHGAPARPSTGSTARGLGFFKPALEA